MKAVSTAGGNASGSNTLRLLWTRADWLAVLLLVLGTALAVGRFWQPGVSSDADMLMGIYRVFELNQAWQNGILYPRLGADLNFTYGAPLFQYYPPLASYGSLIFHRAGLGLIEASKLMFSLSLLLGSLGVTVYTRWLFGDRRAALVSGLMYLFSPYLLTNVYERGAAAESLALAIIPWVFWAVHRLLVEERGPWFWISAVLIGMLVLAHNITALFVLPAVLAGALVLALSFGRLNRLPIIGLAVVVGLGLSAFYWLPALAEIGYVQIEASMVDETKNVIAHLVPLRHLVQTSLVFDYWDQMRFHSAFWQVLLGMAGIVGIAFQDRQRRPVLLFMAGVWLLTLVLQLSFSQPFWEGLPLIRFIQFPWRLLGLGSLCLAVLTGSLFLLRPLRGIPGLILAVVLLGSIVYVSTVRLSPEQSPIWYRITSAELSQQDLFERGSRGFALFSDYLPGTVHVSTVDLPRSRSSAESLEASKKPAPLIQVLEEAPNRLKLLVASKQPFELQLHRFYFPGWQAYAGSQAIPVIASGQLGLVSVSLPSGVYPLEIRLGDTRLRST
ncbi:MAG: glycosyltransferase family 39 protein, partial [Anaerolineae bacterium]|nr:glycosyltransferase family 39 protein [Anaerolineae bacterium]